MTNSRNTIQRQLVLSAVRQLQNHPTADEVYQVTGVQTCALPIS